MTHCLIIQINNKNYSIVILVHPTPLFQHLEADTRGILWKKVFLKISQNSQKSIFARLSFSIIKQNTSGRLLLNIYHLMIFGYSNSHWLSTSDLRPMLTFKKSSMILFLPLIFLKKYLSNEFIHNLFISMKILFSGLLLFENNAFLSIN